MAAIANPAVNRNGPTSNGNGAYVSNGGRSAVPENSAVGLSRRGLVSRIDLSDEWTHDEQSLLDELLAKYSSDPKLLRYGKISNQFQYKTMRHVAIRCIWTEKEKRMRDNKRQKITEQVKQLNSVRYGQSPVSMEIDDVITYKVIGGELGKLLEQNAQSLDQISANISDLKVHENFNLFCQTRNNIITVLNKIKDMSEVMKQMPPLPVKLNEELINSILPQ